MKKYILLGFLASCGSPFVTENVTVVGKQGPQGLPGDSVVGPQGEQGERGESGASCSVTELIASLVTPNGGALIECASTSVVVHNGAVGATGAAGSDGIDGSDGQDGQDAVLPPMTISQVINPCGKQGAFDEVLFKMQNNKLYALYYSPPNSFLTELSNGSYSTTDGTSCAFSVLNGAVTSSPAATVQ